MAASLCCPSILQPQAIKKQFAQAIFHISKSNQNQAYSHSSFTAHIKKLKATCKMCSNWAIKAEKKKRRLNTITESVNFGIFDSNVCFIDFQHTLPTRYIKRKKNVTVKEWIFFVGEFCCNIFKSYAIFHLKMLMRKHTFVTSSWSITKSIL